jgi:hypothetical protein
MTGLRSKQAYTLEHIGRCDQCGAWMVFTTRHGGQRPTCSHLTPKSAVRKAS